MLNVAVVHAAPKAISNAITYYVHRPGGQRWLGQGARALGLTGRVDPTVFRSLLEGRSPDGTTRLVRPVLRAHPKAKLPAEPLARAVADLAAARGVGACALLSSSAARADYARVARAASSGGVVRADVAGRLCRQVGLDPGALYGDAYQQALRWAAARVDQRVAAIDLPFRAPKSVSVLFGLADPRVGEQVAAAHDAAVSAAVGYLEQVASFGLRGHHGDGARARVVGTDGFIAAAFRHATSRAGDPLLHTHVVVLGLMRGVDGGWSAVPTGRLFQHAKTAGYLYQRALRAELSRRLGVAWTPVVNGTAELAGVPRELVEVFSTRRAQIVAWLAAVGLRGPRAAQVAALRTRPAATTGVGMRKWAGGGEVSAEARARWRARARAAGFDPAALHQLGWIQQAFQAGFDPAARADRSGQAGPTPAPPGQPAGWPGVEAASEELAGPRGLTYQHAAFTLREVTQGFAARLHAPATAHEAVAEVLRAARRFVANPRWAVPLLPPAGRARRSREVRYSTPELLATEARVLRHAVQGARAGCAVLTGEQVEAAIARCARTLRRSTPGFAFRAEQLAMIRHVTTSGNAVDVIIGVAGAGKTTALAAINAAYTQAGYHVIGTALANQAVQQLAAGTGIRHCTSVAKLLADLDRGAGWGLGPGAVLVVDEAGMVGTRDYDRLFTHAAAARAKVVLVGDDQQLPAIQAGGVLRGLARRLGAAELRAHTRQHHPGDREALERLRAGDAGGAVGIWQRHGQVTVAKHADQARALLLAGWWRSPWRAAHQAVMLAYRRADVAVLNAAAHAMRVAAGEVTPGGLVVGGQEFGVGDRVITLRNTGHPAAINGTRATVTAVDRARGSLTVRTDGGVLLTLPQAWLTAGEGLQHAYALTGHKGQGMTVCDAHVLGTGQGKLKEWGYVALSRHAIAVHLYVTAAEWDGELDQPYPQPPENPLAGITCALSRSDAKLLATDLHASERDPGVGIEEP